MQDQGGVSGGFITGADRFDARFFGVAPAEAAAIDPQQRLLLEMGYTALHGGGSADRGSKARRLGSSSGLGRTDYAELASAAALLGGGSVGVHSAVGASAAAAAGRLSFALGLQAERRAEHRLLRRPGRLPCRPPRLQHGDASPAALAAAASLVLPPLPAARLAAAGVASQAVAATPLTRRPMDL